MHLVLKLKKNKNPRRLFKATTDAADNSKLYSIFGTPVLSEKNFCDGREMNFTSPLGGTQQADAPETAVKSITPCSTFDSRLQARRYKFVFHYHQLPHEVSISGRDQPWYEFSSIYTLHNVWLIANHPALIRST